MTHNDLPRQCKTFLAVGYGVARIPNQLIFQTERFDVESSRCEVNAVTSAPRSDRLKKFWI